MDTKKALVTGAGKRLGRAMALSLAKRGYDVAVHYATSERQAAEVVAEIKNLGQKGAALQADLLDENQCTTLVGRAAGALGGALSVLINNASIFEYDNIETATAQSWERSIGSNLRAPFVLTQAFARTAPRAQVDDTGEMVSQSLVVNMLDQRVLKLTPEFMTYTIAKMGLWAFTQTAARALGPDVRVNAIGPGTTMIGAKQSEDQFSRQRAGTVLKRGANPHDIVAALNYFLDAPAVTGQLLCVDGGQHLAWQSSDILGIS